MKPGWLTAGMMSNNISAVSNMLKHNVRNTDNRAESTIEASHPRLTILKKRFTRFENFMVNLKENTTKKEFENDLTEYSTKMIELVK